jgi:hypothetical protein
MAEPAVLDLDLHHLVAQGTEVNLTADELLFCGSGDPGVDLAHHSPELKSAIRLPVHRGGRTPTFPGCPFRPHGQVGTAFMN